MSSPTMADLLLERAAARPTAVAYEQPDDDGRVHSITYGQLASRASVLAEHIHQSAPPGSPVLLALPAGIGYAVAVFAGFLAGRPVIPAYPEGASSPDRGRLSGIIADARPAVVIAPDPSPELEVATTLGVPGEEADTSTSPLVRPAGPGDVAVIQYTSGSTGTPRGVLVRHESLVANTAAIIEAFGLNPQSRALTWLPPFHDMGLVGGLLTPVHAGIPIRILAPQDFLKAPLWWLRQISESGATSSGGPNFAYDLCLRRLRSPEQLDGLDLSRWQVAFNGGERVRPETLTGFAEAFAPAGFRAEAFLPCYGLAEATLMVSAGHWSPSAAAEQPSVSCGRPVPGQHVRIVDPATGAVRPDGTEGEVWVAGRHVTHGYLTGETSELFGVLDGVRHVRTGDLGRIVAGELVVTGRVKDVLVVNGVNHHATDIETAALREAGAAGRSAAAFLVDSGRDPVSVLVLESGSDRDETFARRLRSAVLAATGLRLSTVVVTPPRSIPRTSSGKVRRSTCRDALLAGYYAQAVIVGDEPSGGRPTGSTPEADTDGAVREITHLLDGIVAEICGAPDPAPGTGLVDLGMDSVRSAEAAAVLEEATGLRVPFEAVIAAEDTTEVARTLLRLWVEQGSTAREVSARLRALTAEAGVPA